MASPSPIQDVVSGNSVFILIGLHHPDVSGRLQEIEDQFVGYRANAQPVEGHVHDGEPRTVEMMDRRRRSHGSPGRLVQGLLPDAAKSAEHTSELQSPCNL